MLDTALGKVLGSVASFAAAVFLYRAVYKLFQWIFTTRVFEVGGWLATSVGAVLLIAAANRLWSRWRLVFGGTLPFFSVWLVFYRVPQVHAAATAIRGYYADRFDLIHTNAAWYTALVLAVIGFVALSREGDVTILRAFLRKKTSS
jgi:hypothetical protein